MSYIRTYTGAKFNTNPDDTLVRIQDIAIALSRAPRWGGHTKKFYPVSAHCIYVSKILPKKHKFPGLMHDGSEAYITDIPSPFKRLLPDYKLLEGRVMDAISKAYSFEWPMAQIIKDADAVALYQERLHLFDLKVGEDVPHVEFADFPKLKIPEWDWDIWTAMSQDQHAQAFFDTFKQLRANHK